ncbi:acyltransferase family protein [Streptococcus moroccensis]|uniref:Peptidoglycan/LPS O-acetylase OafA/YrhL n=1 Tax=Streptococcus moroccensis TaxID=1451356 RepID=A0ABT9YNJ4_9STRE|nr:acyltransferase family protein [Streptococcus moroccensis]MDQ0221560.1 peptidoglycan/LPS O-acetylase OafA/YrhL [Streptococcus moroccensis]
MRIKWFSLVRILGMSLVLLYHFAPTIFKGGFLGVDIFLVFSGFLTTAIFLDEFSKTETIDLLGFYRRRLYRILPPVLLMIGVVIPFTLLIRSDFRAGIGSQIAAVIGFVTNYFEIAQGGSYENQFVPHLFVHTWTLAMEVQLYIVLGALTWGLSRLAKTKEQLRGFLFALSGLFFLMTFGRFIWSTFNSYNLSSIYYATGKHGFTFFLGAILATFTGVAQTTTAYKQFVQKLDTKKHIGLIVGAVLVLGILTFTAKFESLWTYWVGFILASLATIVLIFSLRLLHDKTPTIAEPAVLGYLANISYGVYLFHWPFLIIFSEMANKGIAIGLSLLFSIAFASLSFYILEPLLIGKPVTLMGVELDLNSAKKPLAIIASIFALFTIGLSAFSPRIGALEKDLMLKGLEQADTKMLQTRSLVDNKVASDYGVMEGTVVIGDSVALRASDGLSAAIDGVIVEGEVSRTLEGAYEFLQESIKNQTLPQNIVIAAGTNPITNYQEVLDNIVKTVPQGHRLILVTPYDGRVAGNPEALPNVTRDYELELAQKNSWITVADWHKVASNSPQIWHFTDYVHFGNDADSISEGQDIYAKTVTDALEKASQEPVKLTMTEESKD